MVLPVGLIWRDYETDGVPSSGPRKPNKPDIRAWGLLIESTPTYASVAAALADFIPATTVFVRTNGFTSSNKGSALWYSVPIGAGPALCDQFLSDGGTRRWQLTDESFTGINCGIDPLVADNAAVLQAYFNRCIARGIKAILPAGVISWASPIVLNLANLGLNAAGHFRIEGQGKGQTSLVYAGPDASQAITINGSWNTGTGQPYNMLYLKGFTSSGTSMLQNGWFINSLIHLTYDDVLANQFLLSTRFLDIVALKFVNSDFMFNVNGILCDNVQALGNGNGGALSPVNEVDFFGCHITNNRGYGANFIKSGPVNFYGGSIEANGLPGAWTAIAATQRYDLKIVDGGYNSGAPLNMFGTHLESSAGVGNILIEHWNIPTSAYNFYGCDFTQNGTTAFVTNSIAVTSFGTGKVKINFNGCNFWNVNGYVPDGAKRRIAAYASGSGLVSNIEFNIDPSCFFQSPTVDGPSNLLGRKFTREAQTSVRATFSVGASPALQGNSLNVTSVVRSAVGVYVVTPTTPLDHAGFIPKITLIAVFGTRGFATLGSLALNSFVINTYDNAGTSADVGSFIAFEVSGGLNL